MRRHRSSLTFRLNLMILVLLALTGVSLRAQTARDAPLPSLASADKVVVVKGARQLLLMRDGEVLKAYSVSLGANPVGPKIRQVDSRTPEGNYVLALHNPFRTLLLPERESRQECLRPNAAQLDAMAFGTGRTRSYSSILRSDLPA